MTESVIDITAALGPKALGKRTPMEGPVAEGRARALSKRLHEVVSSGALAPECQNLLFAALDPTDASPEAMAAKIASVERALAAWKQTAAPPRALPTPAERVRARIGAGPLAHIPTGIPTLDEITRGGLLASRLHVLGGAPDAGKTSLAVQIAYHAARNGYAVAIHCVDEDCEGTEGRIGQIEKLTLEDLEQRRPEALAYLADRLDEVPGLLIVDQDEDGLLVEDTTERLVEMGKGQDCKGLVLVVDSLQTARVRGVDEVRGGKERADLVTMTLKRIARSTGATVIVTSELARAAYRSKETRDRIEPMAAFKESGAIEYAMTTGLVLNNVPGESDLIEVDVPKNKRGRRGVVFRLKHDPRRSAYEDLGLVEPASSAEALGRGASDARVERNVLDTIRGRSLKSANEVCEAVGGNRQRTLQAFKRLVAQQRVVVVAGTLRVAVPSAEAGDWEDEHEARPVSACAGLRDRESNELASDVTPRTGGSTGSTGSGTTYPKVVPLVPRPEGAEPRNHHGDAAGGDPLARAKAAIVAVLQAHPGAPSFDGVRIYTGRDYPAWKLRLAWIDLCRGGDLQNQGTARAPSWRVAGRPPEPAPPE